MDFDFFPFYGKRIKILSRKREKRFRGYAVELNKDTTPVRDEVGWYQSGVERNNF